MWPGCSIILFVFGYCVDRARLRQLGIGFATLALGTFAGWAQTLPTPTTDCSDPRYSGAGICQVPSSVQDPSGRYPSVTPPQQQQPTQQTDSVGRDVYVDSAGFPQNPNTLTQERRVLRPEPLTDLQKLARQSTGELLPIFGRELFRNPPSTFAPVDQIPASPDYVLGPGDEVLLRISGHTNENLRLTVDRSGAIYVPHLGSVNVAGLRFRDLDQRLRQELGRTYKNFEFSANLGKLRSIQVFVLGEAYAPGSYTVSSLSTAFNALLSSGGPTPQGSLRAVQIRRGSGTIATLDLYDLILKGDRTNDLVLQSGDVIFIPFVGPQIAISGSVKHPAIYEVGPSDTLKDALADAGGPSSTASEGRVAIERIEDHHVRRAMSVSLDQAGLATPVLGGDVLHVDPVSIGYKDSVTIRGNLANSGRFPWHEGMKLSDIIPDRESLLTNDYWRDRIRLGLPTPLFEPTQDRRSATDLQNDRNSDRPLANQYPNQYSRSQTQQRTPADGSLPDGQYPYSYPDPDRQAPDSPRTALEARERLTDPDSSQQDNRGSLADQQVASTRNLAPRGRTTEIQIAVPEIDWSYAVIQRLDPKTLRNSLVPFDLGKLVNGRDPSQDLPLQPGDIVTILSQNDIHVRQDDQTKYVRLEGEFVNAGVYSVAPGETLQDVVRKAGGLTDKAYLYGSSFTRESARVLQQQRLTEYVSTLTTNMERESAFRSLSATGAAATLGASSNQSALIEQIRRMRATGRVVLEFKPASGTMDAIPAIPMEDGDLFRVPSRPAVVSVVGSVNGQNVFLYNSASRVRNYLLLAGKPNRVADPKRAFIIRADGSIYSHDTRSGPWGENFNAAPIYPGDTIVIPEKPIRQSRLRDVIDYSQLFSQLALGAAAVQVLR